MVARDGRPPEQAAPLPLQGSPQGGAQPQGRCSLTGLERAGEGLLHRGPRDSGWSLAPPGRVQSSFSFLCSPDPAMMETMENMQEGRQGLGQGLVSEAARRGAQEPKARRKHGMGGTCPVLGLGSRRLPAPWPHGPRYLGRGVFVSAPWQQAWEQLPGPSDPKAAVSSSKSQ